MRTLIRGGTLLTPQDSLVDHQVLIEGDRIVEVGPTDQGVLADFIIDADGMTITPGLIDLHIHGSYGYDTMDTTALALERIGHFLAECGVTGYLATTVTESSESIHAAISNVEAYRGRDPGALPLGVHLEGPYISPDYRGAQDPQFIRSPDPKEYGGWLRSPSVKLLTVAPELPGSEGLIRQARRAGKKVAVGHTGASYEQVILACEWGISQSTHTFNGMDVLHHRRPGVVGAVLTEGGLYAQIIADGLHVHPAMVHLLLRAKDATRTILITDAIRAAGLGDGRYRLGGQELTVRDGEARVASGSLAGSTLTLDAAVRNVMAFTGVSFQKAVSMATYTPAVAMGWTDRIGTVRPGNNADLTLFDDHYMVRMTIVKGKVVFDNR